METDYNFGLWLELWLEWWSTMLATILATIRFYVSDYKKKNLLDGKFLLINYEELKTS